MRTRDGYLDDVDRFNENLDMNREGEIVDKGSFFHEAQNYINKTMDVTPFMANEFLERAFINYRAVHPDVMKVDIFKRAGGKNLKMDRQKDAKIIVENEKTYVKLGSQKADFEGLDTKTRRFGRIKGKPVRIKTGFIVRRKKKVLIFRDRRGRFASVKR